MLLQLTAHLFKPWLFLFYVCPVCNYFYVPTRY